MIPLWTNDGNIEAEISAMISCAVKEEREACARIAETLMVLGSTDCVKQKAIAAKIRERDSWDARTTLTDAGLALRKRFGRVTPGVAAERERTLQDAIIQIKTIAAEAEGEVEYSKAFLDGWDAVVEHLEDFAREAAKIRACGERIGMEGEWVDEAVAAERAACAKIAEQLQDSAWKVYKGLAPEVGIWRRADPHTEGQSDAAGELMQLIRARGKEQG